MLKFLDFYSLFFFARDSESVLAGGGGGVQGWGHRLRTWCIFFDSSSAGPQQMCPVMSWLLCLCLWVSVTAIQLCQATFYDTIQQHHGMRPGRTTIHTIGESFGALSPAPHKHQKWEANVALACWVWSIMCLMRLSPSLDKLTALHFVGFISIFTFS